MVVRAGGSSPKGTHCTSMLRSQLGKAPDFAQAILDSIKAQLEGAGSSMEKEAIVSSAFSAAPLSFTGGRAFFLGPRRLDRREFRRRRDRSGCTGLALRDRRRIFPDRKWRAGRRARRRSPWRVDMVTRMPPRIRPVADWRVPDP